MRRFSTLAAIALAVFMTAPAQAADAAGTAWPVPGIEAPELTLVLEAFVTISAAVTVGPSDHGERQFIPITGGRFAGEGIRGEVMAGGADWQLRRPDGALELHAIYSLRADDGAVIVVDNQGVGAPVPGAASGTGGFYLRTVPRFHAPQGKHDWLNKGVFVGTVTPGPAGGAVIIRVFKVQ